MCHLGPVYTNEIDIMFINDVLSMLSPGWRILPMTVSIRPFEAADLSGFVSMWQAFTATAPDEPGNPDMGALNFERVQSGPALRGIVAVDAQGALLGFTLFLSFPFTWARGEVCYL